MNNFKKIKNMNIKEMARFLCQGIECTTYGSVGCEECCMNKKYKSLCFYCIKDLNEKDLEQWLESEG